MLLWKQNIIMLNSTIWLSERAPSWENVCVFRTGTTRFTLIPGRLRLENRENLEIWLSLRLYRRAYPLHAHSLPDQFRSENQFLQAVVAVIDRKPILRGQEVPCRHSGTGGGSRGTFWAAWGSKILKLLKFALLWAFWGRQEPIWKSEVKNFQNIFESINLKSWNFNIFWYFFFQSALEFQREQ